MRIDGVGSNPSLLYGVGPVRAVAPAGTTGAAQQINAATLALLQAEQKGGGGGGGGHGHSSPKVLSALEDLAARASLRIEQRAKTPEERMAEIARLRAQQAEAGERVGERQDGDGDPAGRQRQNGQEDTPSNQDQAGQART